MLQIGTKLVGNLVKISRLTFGMKYRFHSLIQRINCTGELVKTGASYRQAAEKVRVAAPNSTGQRRLCKLLWDAFLSQSLSGKVDNLVHQVIVY